MGWSERVVVDDQQLEEREAVLAAERKLSIRLPRRHRIAPTRDAAEKFYQETITERMARRGHHVRLL